ncbi:MAG: DUF1559 domain-containing protein [Pirellulales bacterium]|nr:DUF1559 domain-containing protein [Pirellulales bacterium]
MISYTASIVLKVASIFVLIAIGSETLVATEQPNAPKTAAEHARIIAPFIDEQTVAIAHIDINKIQIGPLLDEVVKFFPELKPQLPAGKAALGAVLNTIKQAGGSDIYYIITIDGLRKEEFLIAIVPLTEKSVQSTLEAIVKQSNPKGFDTFARVGDVLVGGPKDTVERLKVLKPDSRPEIEKAFATTEGSTARVLILPPRHVRRVIEEMMPELPEEIGGGSSKAISDGFLWATIGFDSPSRLALSALIQSKDQQSAQALLDTWKRIYPRLFDDEDKKGVFGKPGIPKSKIDKLITVFMPKVDNDRLMLEFNTKNGGIAKLVDIGRAVYISGQQSAVREGTINICKQLGLAMFEYENEKGSFPADSYNAGGKPLLSWRVHLLPYLGRAEFYKKFHLDEPWDSAHNKKLIAQDPYFFRMQRTSNPGAGLTNFLVPVGSDTVFPGKKSLRLKDIKNPSSTILIVEVDEKNAVPWTKPADMQYDPKQPAKGLGQRIPEGFTAVFCDGHVESIPRETNAEKLREMFDRNR